MTEKKRLQRDLPQINANIRFPKLRVIDSEGGQVGIISRDEALELADKKA